MSGASRAPSGGTRRTAYPPLGALCKARYRITSIGLPPQESRDVQQILRVGGRSQPIPDRPLPLDGGLVERRVVAAGEWAAHHAHRRLGTHVALLAAQRLAFARGSERRAHCSNGPT